MASLLTDWVEFCEGRERFDKSHFLGLFKSHNSDAELRNIFKYFPFSEELVRRAASVISFGEMNRSLYLLPKGGGAEGELLLLAEVWLAEQERICRVLDNCEILEICRKVRVRFVGSETLEHSLCQDIPHYWLFDQIADAVRGSRIVDGDQIYALFEALYGLAADYYLAWHVGRPLFLFEIDLEPYLRFWGKGGRCALTENEFLVSR